MGRALPGAQSAPELPQPSPKARVEQRVGLTDFAVAYSSPGVKGRPIWGELVPYGELWRSGANAATTLQASRDFTFGGVRVPAGTYALYTIPGKGRVDGRSSTATPPPRERAGTTRRTTSRA